MDKRRKCINMKNSLFHFHKETKETTDNMQNRIIKNMNILTDIRITEHLKMMETIKAMGRNRQSRIRKV